MSSARTIQVEQALYGDDRGGHALLASSGVDAVSTEIVHRLDLPDTAPPGVEWSPFLRGFPYGDRYVLSRTFHDTGASRGGMVFSHALLAPLDDMMESPNLEPLLGLFATSHRQRPDVTTAQVVCAETRTRQASDLIEIAEALVSSDRFPIVRLGNIGFDDLIVALWANLLPGIRRNFAFRLSFDPRDLVETPIPTLVCTPVGMAARWSQHTVIRSGGRREPDSLAAAILSCRGKADPLIEFMQEKGVEPTTFSDLRLVEKAYRFDVGEPTLDRRVSVARLIERLSPDSDIGVSGKDVVIRRLCDVLIGAGAEEILRLRNLKLSAFPSPSRIWNEIERWVAENRFAQGQDTEMLTILKDATTSDAAVQEWRNAILKGLAIAAGAPKRSFARAFWRWLQVHPQVVAAVSHHVPMGSKVEERLATAAPRNLDEEAAESVIAFALSRGWLRLHGATLSASCSTSNAAKRQLSVDTDQSFVEGLQFALGRAKPTELVECALEIEDPRIARLAGDAVARDPSLLRLVDMTTSKAQAMWREALTIEPECWRGPKDPESAFRSILDGLLNGGDTDASLIERLSITPVADIGTYPSRPKVWSHVVGVARQNLLARTAIGWLQKAASVGVPFVPEYHLEAAILEDEGLEQTFDTLIPESVGTVVRIVTALGRYDQEKFLCLLSKTTTRSTSIAVLDAEVIGRLAMERQWEHVAADLVGKYKTGRLDLKPGLRACCELLDFWERFVLGLSPVSEREKWKGFEELAVLLYPSGPDELELWERAGGDGADLSIGRDGRTRWRRTVSNIRNGRGPTPAALLAAMMEDFPNNERIPHLAGDGVFGRGGPDVSHDE